MPWPRSRSETASPEDEAGEAGSRQGETRDPAAELRARTRRRLIGAAAMLLAAVIVLPMLLDTAPRPMRDDIAITVTGPPPAAAGKATQAKPPEVDEKMAEPAPVRTEAEQAPLSAPAPPSEPVAAQPALGAPPEKSAPPESARHAEPSSAATPAQVVVQVAALSSPAAAEELMIGLIKSGFTAYVEPTATASGIVHRVRVGPFASRGEAQRAVERLKAAGHKATVVGG